jgi:hypothetical protein
MGVIFRDSETPEWKTRLQNIKNKDVNTINQYNNQLVYGKNEVGMKNPNTQSHLKIYDNGNIELLAGDASGISINDTYDTVNIYGNSANMNTHRLSINTRPYGFVWNGYLLNPQLYQLYNDDLRLEASTRYWVEATDKVPAHWARQAVSIRPFIKCTESDEFQSILNDLKIPT